MKTHHSTLSSDESRTIITRIIANLPNVGKRQSAFIAHVLTLFLVVRGRRNFTNAARYGFHTESAYRRAFAEPFDWLSFNVELVRKSGGSDAIIAFDPSFIPKSRKKTAHIGMFWSGASGKALHGLEIGCLAAVDLGRNTALHLEAVQTPNTAELKAGGKTQTDHYLSVIVDRKDSLERLSKYLVVDGYFAKRKFVNGVLEHTNLDVVTKLRNDADLWYLYTGNNEDEAGPSGLTAKSIGSTCRPIDGGRSSTTSIRASAPRSSGRRR
jgi:hypothetical protein